MVSATAAAVRHTLLITEEVRDRWDSYWVADYAPAPPGVSISNEYDLGHKFKAELQDVSPGALDAYKAAAAEYGFTEDVEKTANSLVAFNKGGVKLNYMVVGGSGILEVELPPEFDALQWPENGALAMLPAPDAETGAVEINVKEAGIAYVAGTTRSQFEEYVKVCRSLGFTQDVNEDEDSYFANNAKGRRVGLCYEGGSVMRVAIGEKTEFTKCGRFIPHFKRRRR